MIDWTDDKNNYRWTPMMVALIRLETLEYAGAVKATGWKELAIVLAEECVDLDHAKRAIDGFLKSTRLDEKGFEKHTIPSAPELREFVRKVPEKEPPPVPMGEPPEPCEKCRPNDGTWQMVNRGGVEVPIYCDCPRAAFLEKRRAAHRGALGGRP